MAHLRLKLLLMPQIQPLLSVVIPAYNEAVNFKAGVLDPVVAFLGRQKYLWEVILVDDGSTDDTYQLLGDFCRHHQRLRLLRIVHGGKAAAVTTGMLAARGRYVLFTDFDQSTPIDHVSDFLAAHRRGAEVVIGVRTQTQNDTWVRRIRSWVFVTLVQIVALPGIRDSQCGFKSFSAPAAKAIFSRLVVGRPRGQVTGGYMGAFDVEALFLARKTGFEIHQVPVHWIKYVSDRLNIWHEPAQMLIDTVKVRLYDILGRYDGDKK